MDNNELYEHGRARFEHAAQRRLLKEKYQAKMLFAHAGGMWQAGPELLALLGSLPVKDSVVLLDLYDTPIQINPGELHNLAFERWQEQLNAWLTEFDQIASQR